MRLYMIGKKDKSWALGGDMDYLIGRILTGQDLRYSEDENLSGRFYIDGRCLLKDSFILIGFVY